MIKNQVFFLYFLLISTLLGCGLAQTRPKLEMGLAAAALNAARESKAPVLSPNLYRKGELYLEKAKASYKQKYFNKAKQYALLSKQFSEKAEFMAIKKATLDNISPE